MLQTTNNSQMGWYFINLSMGQIINHFTWTALPMTECIANQFNQMDRNNPKGMKLLDIRGNKIPKVNQYYINKNP